jgi:hypothetical protein
MLFHFSASVQYDFHDCIKIHRAFVLSWNKSKLSMDSVYTCLFNHYLLYARIHFYVLFFSISNTNILLAIIFIVDVVDVDTVVDFSILHKNFIWKK